MMLVWWSGDHKFLVIMTPHWRPDDRELEGYSDSVNFFFSSSPCVPVGRAGCNLLDGHASRKNLTVFGVGW